MGNGVAGVRTRKLRCAGQDGARWKEKGEGVAEVFVYTFARGPGNVRSGPNEVSIIMTTFLEKIKLRKLE